MPQRSQRHKAEMQAITGPPITNILPNTATIAAAGAVGRTVATLSVTGGTAPVNYLIADAAGMSIAIAGNLVQTTVNPVSTVGAKAVQIMASEFKEPDQDRNHHGDGDLMAVLRIQGFSGNAPVSGARALPDNFAVESINTWLYGGELRGIRPPEPLQVFNTSTPQGAEDTEAHYGRRSAVS